MGGLGGEWLDVETPAQLKMAHGSAWFCVDFFGTSRLLRMDDSFDDIRSRQFANSLHLCVQNLVNFESLGLGSSRQNATFYFFHLPHQKSSGKRNDWLITPIVSMNFRSRSFQKMHHFGDFFLCHFPSFWSYAAPSQEPKGLSKAASSVKTAVQTLSHLSDTSLANVLIEDARLVFFFKTGSLTEGFRMDMMVLGVACFCLFSTWEKESEVFLEQHKYLIRHM